MKSSHKGLLAGSVLAAMAAGGVFGATVLAPASSGAATASTTATATATAPANNGYGAPPASNGGHMANGITEKVLTGDDAAKVKAAALAAVPGGTVQRVENDAEGATYEAHMTKSDGTQVTVKLDASFKVTSVENGMR
jgi:hypothetical protein